MEKGANLCVQVFCLCAYVIALCLEIYMFKFGKDIRK